MIGYQQPTASQLLAWMVGASLCWLPAGLAAQDYSSDSTYQTEQINRFVDPTLLWRRLQELPKTPAPTHVSKQPGHYSTTDWTTAIDTTWGMGMTGIEKADVFNQVWDRLNIYGACFSDRDTTYWDSIKAVYDACDFDTVSRGQFCGLMQYVTGMIRDGHSHAVDSGVVLTEPVPGIPLLIGFPGEEGHFGAGLTPLPDSSLLVYDALKPHPLGLLPGDLVLGYDGITWPQLVREIKAAEMPMLGIIAAHDATDYHLWMNMAGMNWHLFDTIDVVKYATGDTVHLPTSLLAGQDMEFYASEQLDIPNVPKPDYESGKYVTWGMVEGTTIGYIYHEIFEVGAEAQWDEAVRALVLDSITTGLIVDVRLNFGGWVAQIPPFRYLFDSTLEYIRWDQRCAGGGRWDMCPAGYLDPYYIIQGGYHASYYDKPIALLTGPNTISCGDVFALALGQHPMTKVFGKPTHGAFNVMSFQHHPVIEGWECWLADRNSYLITDTTEYLTRQRFPDPLCYPEVDFEEVWLTQEGVAQGRDDVVETALSWILSRDYDQDGIVNENDNCPSVNVPGNDWIKTGDADVNGSLSSSDVIWLVNYTFKSGMPPLPVAAAGDTDCNGKVDAADIIQMVNHLFKSGPEPCDVCAGP